MLARLQIFSVFALCSHLASAQVKIDVITWRPLTIPNITDPRVIVPDPKIPGRLYAGSGILVYTSDDDGKTWRAAPMPMAAQVNNILADPASGSIYASGDEYVVSSSDGFKTSTRAVPWAG